VPGLECLQLGSLEPATHAYAAWEGFPLEAKKAVGDLFARTPSLRAITIVQRYIRAQVSHSTRTASSLQQVKPAAKTASPKFL
jgi:hypothetical protein